MGSEIFDDSTPLGTGYVILQKNLAEPALYWQASALAPSPRGPQRLKSPSFATTTGRTLHVFYPHVPVVHTRSGRLSEAVEIDTVRAKQCAFLLFTHSLYSGANAV